MTQPKHTPTILEQVQDAAEMSVKERMDAVENLKWYQSEYAKLQEENNRLTNICIEQESAQDDLVAALEVALASIIGGGREESIAVKVIDAALAKAKGE